MTEDQILRTWMMLDGGSLVLLFVGALTNKVIVFRDKRKLGHVAIFFMLFGIFGWFVNVLVNGEKQNIELNS